MDASTKKILLEIWGYFVAFIIVVAVLVVGYWLLSHANEIVPQSQPMGPCPEDINPSDCWEQLDLPEDANGLP